jgi:hypothetical protein
MELPLRLGGITGETALDAVITMSRFLTALIVGALFALGATPAAVGKEGVRARLDMPLPLHAAAGKTITVAWTLSYIESGERHPFGASGVFVRLRSASGGRPVSAYGKGRGTGPYRGGVGVPGTYIARVTVPEGGIGGIKIGLRGWRIIGGRKEGRRIIGGRKERADAFFQIDNDPFARAGAAAGTRRDARSSAQAEDAGDPLAIWLVGAGALSGLGAILAVRWAFASRRARRGDLA